MKTTITNLAIFMFLLLLSCNNDDDNFQEYQPIHLDLKAKQIVKASNQFSFDLYKSIDQVDSKNILISPFSVSQALGMTWNGAASSTLSEMTDVLHFSNDDPETVNESNQKVREALINSDSKVKMHIANSIWYRNSYSISQDFLSTNKKYYNAEVRALDFSKSDECKKIINKWVSDNTKGLIPEIVEGVSPDHVMFLINAIYFKGQWTYRFDKQATSDQPFILKDGTSVDVPMMNVEADLKVNETNNCTAFALPYGNGHFEMLVLLPQQNESLESLNETFSDGNWEELLSGMEERGVNLFLPKFQFKYERNLNNDLKHLGMPTPFTNAADFSRMNASNQSDLKISKVKHKCFIELNEEGTEAAAVTSVEIVNTSAGSDYVPEIRVDCPFAFVIREKDTGAILFMGRVNNPNLKE
ncbi:MAG: serpin family protein [Carboxylicivirga sp.]|jgi:serpin B|nr:serpin family protein [Carboxylicivirga sp.]